MTKGRLEAFSDGVIAILITIMVLELHVPRGGALADLRPLLPVFLAYVLSFVLLAIYWNNHHHLLHATDRISGRVLWANMFLLFWLSLIPFGTGWIGQNYREAVPTALYGVTLLMAGVAYTVLVRALLAVPGGNPRLALALGKDWKGLASLALYAMSVPLAFVRPIIAQGLFVTVALIWLAPDPRIETRLSQGG